MIRSLVRDKWREPRPAKKTSGLLAICSYAGASSVTPIYLQQTCLLARAAGENAGPVC